MPQIGFNMTLGQDVTLPVTWHFGAGVVPISPEAGVKEYTFQWTNTTLETVSMTYAFQVSGLGANKVVVDFESPAQAGASGSTVSNKLLVSVTSSLAANEQPSITVTGAG